MLPKQATLNTLPPLYPEDLIPQIAAAVRESNRKLLVLDDDPTGTQTVYGIPVWTEWSVEALTAELRDPGPLAYILTNSRALPREGAYHLNREIAANLSTALRAAPRPVEVISRSDSTLRGHFPTEIDALCEGLGIQPDGVLVAPFFLEGGRFTINDIHYVADGEQLIPAASTEYAQDAYFGYTHSNLREWIVEKHARLGRTVSYGDISAITLDDLRCSGPGPTAEKLKAVHGGQFVVINAAAYRDLEVLALALTMAEKAGKRFMARSAASYVRVRAGLPARGLLTHDELLDDPNAVDRGQGGLVVAGSYIQKSTQQINAAISLPGVQAVEIHVERLLHERERPAEIGRVVSEAAQAIGAGATAVIYTSRKLITGDSQEQSLQIGQLVSAAVVETVRSLPVRPRWLIAKGGITSSDVATKALGVRRALVLGQIQPGVPVWRTGHESLWPGLTYVVFPGNVGDETAIARAITTLRGQ